jgi:glycerol-3-phosphate dehydrogenase
VAQRVGNSGKCLTHEKPLPGAEEPVDIDAWLRESKSGPLVARSRMTVGRMAYRHGSRSKRMLAMCEADPRQGAHVCACEPVCEAEVRYAVKGELVHKLADIRRRTRLSMGACGGTRCLARASQILADEAGLTVPEQLIELKDAMTGRFVGKRPVMEGANLATEELNQQIHFLTGNLLPYLAAASTTVRTTRSEGTPAPADGPATRALPSSTKPLVVGAS